ncbi:MAG: hypothetical protein COB59_11455 [Rhodospirillaceae bacterium]|nr:MAG: hypothetical protein COB59_11455 [Rhodospirillaceae bacterium]
MTSIDITEKGEDGLRAFIMTLRPRCSADPRVAYGLCGILGFIWLAAGIFIASMGGWPVFGFFGLEFLFIAAMVHIFMRRTQVLETISITQEQVVVIRTELGIEHQKTFPAYWAQAHYGGSPTLNRPLEIRSHGVGIEIGKFLSASEKDRTAGTLNDVLHRQRSHTEPEPRVVNG